MLIGLAGFITAATTLYFAIPFYDDNTNSRQPYTKRLLAGIGIGSINLIAVIILTPSVFISWGARGFSQITMFLNNI